MQHRYRIMCLARKKKKDQTAQWDYQEQNHVWIIGERVLLGWKKFSGSVCLGGGTSDLLRPPTDVWCSGIHTAPCPEPSVSDCWPPERSWNKGMAATAQFLFCSLNYLASCLQGFSCGDQNKLKQNSLLVKPDFSLFRLLMMFWPQHMWDPRHRLCSQEILSYFLAIFPCCRQDSPEL